MEEQILESFFSRGLQKASEDLFKLPDCNVGEPWVRIPAGQFEMGSKDGPEDEQPVHTEIVSRYFDIQSNEVTASQLERLFLGRGSSGGMFPPIWVFSSSVSGRSCPTSGRTSPTA